MIRRLPSDAVLLVLTLATIAAVLGATLLLHHVVVGDSDGVAQPVAHAAADLTP